MTNESSLNGTQFLPLQSLCHRNTGAESLWWHICPFLLLIAIVIPQKRRKLHSIGYFMLTVAFFACAGWIWTVHYELIGFFMYFFLANVSFIQALYISYHNKDTKLTPSLDRLYQDMFAPLRVPLSDFKRLVLDPEVKLKSMTTGDTYAIEHITVPDKLSLLISGSVHITSEGQFLHKLEELSFLDSPEWESHNDSDTDPFQVTITAIQPACYISWPRRSLQHILYNNRYLNAVMTNLIGRDISNKYYFINDFKRNFHLQSNYGSTHGRGQTNRQMERQMAWTESLTGVKSGLRKKPETGSLNALREMRSSERQNTFNESMFNNSFGDSFDYDRNRNGAIHNYHNHLLSAHPPLHESSTWIGNPPPQTVYDCHQHWMTPVQNRHSCTPPLCGKTQQTLKRHFSAGSVSVAQSGGQDNQIVVSEAMTNATTILQNALSSISDALSNSGSMASNADKSSSTTKHPDTQSLSGGEKNNSALTLSEIKISMSAEDEAVISITMPCKKQISIDSLDSISSKKLQSFSSASLSMDRSTSTEEDTTSIRRRNRKLVKTANVVEEHPGSEESLKIKDNSQSSGETVKVNSEEEYEAEISSLMQNSPHNIPKIVEPEIRILQSTPTPIEESEEEFSYLQNISYPICNNHIDQEFDMQGLSDFAIISKENNADIIFEEEEETDDESMSLLKQFNKIDEEAVLLLQDHPSSQRSSRESPMIHSDWHQVYDCSRRTKRLKQSRSADEDYSMGFERRVETKKQFNQFQLGHTFDSSNSDSVFTSTSVESESLIHENASFETKLHTATGHQKPFKLKKQASEDPLLLNQRSSLTRLSTDKSSVNSLSRLNNRSSLISLGSGKLSDSYSNNSIVSENNRLNRQQSEDISVMHLPRRASYHNPDVGFRKLLSSDTVNKISSGLTKLKSLRMQKQVSEDPSLSLSSNSSIHAKSSRSDILSFNSATELTLKGTDKILLKQRSADSATFHHKLTPPQPILSKQQSEDSTVRNYVTSASLNTLSLPSRHLNHSSTFDWVNQTAAQAHMPSSPGGNSATSNESTYSLTHLISRETSSQCLSREASDEAPSIHNLFRSISQTSDRSPELGCTIIKPEPIKPIAVRPHSRHPLLQGISLD